MIPVYKPYLTTENKKYAHEALESGWVSSQGPYLQMVEEILKDTVKAKYCILTNNGTAATHLIAKSLRFKYPNIKRLIVPSNSYVAAWNMMEGFDLYPIDANIDTWNMDRDLLPNLTIPFYKDTTAILAVPNLGNPIDVPGLIGDYKVPVIEDNCEGFLGKYWDSPTGSAGIASSISFFGNKTLTSGEGGAFFTNDEEIYEEMFRVRGQGFTKEKFIFSGMGYNYRMTNIEAALLFGQLNSMKEIIERKQFVFDTYKKYLNGVENVHLQTETEGCEHANWMFGIRFELPKEKVREIILALNRSGVETRPMFPPINLHSHYAHFGEFPVSKRLYETVIVLPSFPELTEYEISSIVKTIKINLK